MDHKDNVFIISDLTPDHLRCSWGGCPSVFALSTGDLLIIGKEPHEELLRQTGVKIADDERAVIVHVSLLQKVKCD